MKRISKTLIVSVLIFTLSACSDRNATKNPVKVVPPSEVDTVQASKEEKGTSGTPPETAVVKSKEVKLVEKTNKAQYLLTNGIEIKQQSKSVETSQGTIEIGLPQISGLVNKQLEARLNRDIITDIEKEWKSYIDETGRQPNGSYCQVQLNASNLLSIAINDFYSTIGGFLYSLEDGKRLSLKDIFTKGTDYIGLMNRQIIEGIAGGLTAEEEYILKAPFSSIKPHQDFAFSPSALRVIFRKGESGFAQRYAVELPLKDIDNYIDIIEVHSKAEGGIYEKTDLVARVNNIFLTQKGEIIKKQNGNVGIFSLDISGLVDKDFEKTINNTLARAANEVLENKALDNLRKMSGGQEDYIAFLYMHTRFNHNGLLTITRSVQANNNSSDTNKLFQVYTFDLVRKKIIDPKAFLEEYLKNNKELQQVFTNLVKDTMKQQLGRTYPHLLEEFNNSIDYKFIISNSHIYFQKHQESDLSVAVNFKENSIKGIDERLEFSIPAMDFIKVSLEELLKR